MRRGRALGAQRLSAQAEEVLKRANDALGRSREAETQRIIPPVQALNYQRALLDATSLLNLRRQDLEYAKRELSALMNVPPGTDFTVADNQEVPLPKVPTDLRALEDLALAQRPELREEDLKKRITGDEARKQLLSMFPSITFDVGPQYDSNTYLYNNGWIQGGMRVSWNLMRLAALPSLDRAQQGQVKADEARRMALAMAVLTQVRVGVERYRLAMTDLQLADVSAQVDKRLADYAKASVSARLDSDLEAVRTRTRALLGDYQRANAYANAQIAFGRIYNSVGLDPLPDNFDQDDLKTLTGRIGEHLKKAEQDAILLSAAPAPAPVAATGAK